MKPPRTIAILGRKFRVKIQKKVIYRNEEVQGLCDSVEKVIYVQKDQTNSEMHETLVHEAAHGMLDISGINQKLTESENEIMCQLITALHMDLIKAFKLKQSNSSVSKRSRCQEGAVKHSQDVISPPKSQ